MAVDLYNEWLQVPPGERPPDHYALLGLPLFCDDTAAIEQAARKRLARLDRYAIHPDPTKREACHRLMNEVARARVVLAAPARKLPYDQELAKSRGAAAPTSPQSAATEQEVAQAEEGAEAEAEAYLMDLARAAQRAAANSRSRTRAKPKQRSSAPLYVAAVCTAALVCIVIWAWQRSSNRPTKPAIALVNPKPAPAVPEPQAPKSIPPPAMPAPHKVTLFDPIDSTTPVPPRETHALPPSPPPVPVARPRVPEPKPPDPLGGLNASLDRLTDWSVEKGVWSFVEPGRLRGEGASDIDFDSDLPANVTISFRLCVIKGMRPRIHFDGPDIYVGNEGYSKKLAVHGKAKILSGEPLDYTNGQDIVVQVTFRGADQFEIHLNDHVLTGTCQPHSKIHLRLSGGDWWSRGTTDYWDLQVGLPRAPG